MTVQVFNLSNITKDGLVELARHLGVKRDYDRILKGELVAMLRSFGTEKLLDAAKAVCEAEGEAFDADDWLTDEADPQEIIEESAERPQPPKAKAKPAPAPAAASPDVGQVASLLAQLLATGAVNPAQVEQIVDGKLERVMEHVEDMGAKNYGAILEMVERRLSDAPARELVVKLGDRAPVKISGHTRPEFEKVLRRAAAGVNQLLVGPAGCGKTHLAAQVAEAMGLPFASVSCSAGMSESALSGWLLPMGESGRFEYVESDFVRLFENGGVFLIDEIDAADENMLLWLNQALANGGFNLPQRSGATRVTRHADFVCIAAANTYGKGGNVMYAGRNTLDESTLDRFRAGTLSLDYDATFEKAAVHPDLLLWGRAVRARIAELQMRRVMSTRFLLDATKLLAVGESIEEIKDTYFSGWKSDERQRVEAGLVTF